MFFYLHAKYISNFAGFKERKLWYTITIFMSKTQNSKKTFHVLKKHFRLICTEYFSICMPNIYQP